MHNQNGPSLRECSIGSVKRLHDIADANGWGEIRNDCRDTLTVTRMRRG